MRRANHRRILFAVLATAFALRVGMAFGVQSALDHVLHRQFVIEGDAWGYWELGRRIAEDEAYSLYEPPRQVLRMPGVPLLLALGMKLASATGLAAHSFLVCRLLLAVIATAGCGFVYLLGRALFDRHVGLWAAGIAAVSPAALGFSVLILSETPFAVALVLNLWCMAKLLSLRAGGASKPAGGARGGSSSEEARGGGRPWARRIGWPIAVGLTGALACYMRPSWLLAIPVFAAFVVVSTERRWGLAAAALIVASLLLALLPWAARNHVVTGHWVFTTLWVGPSLYDGLNPRATGDSDMRFFDEDRLGERMSERDVDREYRRRAWEFVRENPGRAIELAFIKLGRYANPFPNAEQFSQWWLRWPLALFFLAAIGLALYGGIAERANLAAWALCAGPLLYFAAMHMVFVGSIRYRLPAEYPAYVLSAAGAARIFPRRAKGGELPVAN